MITKAADQNTNSPSSDDSDLFERTNLTRNQFLMWLGQKLDPQAPLYNMIQTFTIEGELQPEPFRQAFAALVQASDALRTVIEEVDGVPQQRVLPNLPYSMEFLDFSGSPDPGARYQAWLDVRRLRPFDLSRGLFDTALVRLAAGRCVWYLNQHHLITDGWSFLLVYKGMAEFYRRALHGELDDLPSLPAYGEYRLFERGHRRTPAFSKAEAYWREKLAVPSDPLTFYNRAMLGKTARTERVVCDLGPERSSRLRAIAAEKGIRSLNLDLSLFNLFAAIFCAYLHRVTGARQITLGSPFHNRPTAAFKETIGLFIEMCPLRVEVAEDDTFAGLLKKVMAETFTVLRYAQPGISQADHNRAYQVLLNFVNVAFPAFCGMPTRVEWLHAGYGDRDHSLRLQIHDFNASGSYSLHFDFNCNVFDEQQRLWAVRHFLRVVDSFIEDRDSPIHAFHLLSPEEEQSLLVDYNRTQSPYPADQTVVSLFEAQVKRTPEEVAVVYGADRLTYRELNERANALAHRLRKLGVRPEKLVGICTEHSFETVVGLLGILKAGGAYVPLDPAYPKGRLAFMLDDMRQAGAGEAPLVITQPWLVDSLSEGQARIISLDPTWTSLAGESLEDPPVGAGPGDLAYVIYTSGSTGKPKGAMIEHRGLVNYLWWAKKSYTGGQKLSFPLFSSLSFDLTVTSIYVPLISGGRIVVYREDPGVRGMVILKVIQDDQVDIVKLTPSHLALIKDLDLGATRVKKYIVGGEDFKRDLALAITAAHSGQVEIYNEYGPTETVVGCMIHRFNPQTDPELSVPIGRPADNARIYVLDEHLNPVPPGIIGEMYIGGDGVSRGYLNRPELTAEKFISGPVVSSLVGDSQATTRRPDNATNRLYRTGDLAVWGPDGKLAFLGRADDQVKLGGVRIELGEIETRLRQHPALRDCFLDVVEPAQGQASGEVRFCARCGLASNYPGLQFDAQGVCSLCRSYDTYKDQAQAYFKSLEDLRLIFERAKASRRGDYDCLVLLSGGKDSTYMLYQVAGMGLKVLAFTLDNGYISDQAKANIRRVVEALSVDHIFGTTPAMNSIFADSLKHFSNVCNGCFKTLYTLSVNLAREKGIPCIVTGLSRGQFFETRLTGDLFQSGKFDADAIDAAILAARKAYHRRDDIISRSLDVDVFRQDAVFEDVQFVDFYRYCDAGLDEMYAFLDEHAPWIRPSDTGRSTNCLINDVGIYIHKRRQGYHNYALPYSWDVRLGHKTRQEALDELDDEIDGARVERILSEIGYAEPAEAPPGAGRKSLVAYYVSEAPLTPAELRDHLAQTLPDFMLPTGWVQVDAIPLTQNGKVDRRALSALRPLEVGRPQVGSTFVAPSTPLEEKLAEIWSGALNIARPGVHDNFFELGGSSLPALQVVSRVSAAFGVDLPVQDFFENPTIAQLGELIEDLLVAQIDALSEEEAINLLAKDE